MSQIEMNIPTAADARKAIEKGEYEKATRQAAEIEEAITKAISQGITSTSGLGRLEPPVKVALTEKGYTCESGSQYNESYWSIAWA